MNQERKPYHICAGILFLLRALSIVSSVVTLAIYKLLPLLPVFSIVLSLAGIALMSYMGILALQQKRRSKNLNLIGSLYLGYIALSQFMAMYKQFGDENIFNPLSLLSTMLLIAAFVLTLSKWDKTAELPQSGNADMDQGRYDFYEAQLRSGNLTKEEYEQLTRNRK